MKSRTGDLVLFLTAAILPLSAAMADPERSTADRWHTRVYFTVSHMGLSNYRGRFIEHDIDFMFDEDDFGNSSVGNLRSGPHGSRAPQPPVRAAERRRRWLAPRTRIAQRLSSTST